MVLDELFVGGNTGTPASNSVIDEKTWDAVRAGPGRWYEEYWWLIPVSALALGSVGYGIYKSLKR